MLVAVLGCVVLRLSVASWKTWSWLGKQGFERPAMLVQVDPSCGSCAQLCLWLMEHPKVLERVTIITPEPLPVSAIPTILLDRNVWWLGPATPTLLKVRHGRVVESAIGLPSRHGQVDFQAIEAFILQE
ncbi:MAG: hypothetical protein IPL96_09290 [Holophagaceae bacterium]|nr:hypothetical protein [Holophagaceae bacterium]